MSSDSRGITEPFRKPFSNFQVGLSVWLLGLFGYWVCQVTYWECDTEMDKI